MRILHLISTLTAGGAERQLGYLAGELRRRGHDVHVGYSHRGPGAWPCDLAATRFPLRSPWNVRRVTDALALIRETQPDIIHTWSLATDVIGGLAAAKCSVPWIIRESSLPPLRHPAKTEALRVFLARQFASGVLANSSDGVDYWHSRRLRVPVRFLPNACPCATTAAAEDVPGSRAGSMGIFVGRLDAVKNVDVILAAAARLIREREFVLTICGEGAERQSLEALARQLGIEARVRFLGYQHDVLSHLRRASLSLLVSDVEGTPNAVLEAFAAGTPVVLSDIPAHRDLAPPGSVLFVGVDDVEATARAMAAVLDDPVAAMERAALARSALVTHSVQAAGDALENFYLEVLASHTPRSRNGPMPSVGRDRMRA